MLKNQDKTYLAPMELISSHLVFWDERRDKGESGNFACKKAN
jgi:hypothetical protein